MSDSSKCKMPGLLHVIQEEMSGTSGGFQEKQKLIIIQALGFQLPRTQRHSGQHMVSKVIWPQNEPRIGSHQQAGGHDSKQTLTLTKCHKFNIMINISLSSCKIYTQDKKSQHGHNGVKIGSGLTKERESRLYSIFHLPLTY